MSVWKRLFCHKPWRYAVSGVLGAMVVLLILRGDYGRRTAWADGLTTGGAVLVLMGLLGFVYYHGAFDTFGYAFSTFQDRRWKDLTVYRDAKQEKRVKDGWTFMPAITVGVVLLLAGILLWIKG